MKTVTEYNIFLDELYHVESPRLYYDNSLVYMEKIAKFYTNSNLFSYLRNRINSHQVGSITNPLDGVPIPVLDFYQEQIIKYLNGFTSTGFLIRIKKGNDIFKIVAHIPENLKTTDFNKTSSKKALLRSNKINECLKE